jgi:hypothetical protein
MDNPFANAKTKAPLPQIWFWVVMGFLLAVIGVSGYFNHLSVGAKDARKFLRTMPVDQIREISIEPYAVLSLTDRVIVIRDPGKIRRIAEVFRGMTPVSPNHPAATWVAVIRFQVGDRQYGGQIETTSNQGGLFWMSSRVRGGWNYGTYRNDALGPVFEQLVAEEKNRK